MHQSRLLKKLLLLAGFFAYFWSSSTDSLYAQAPPKEAFESIAKYTAGGFDKTAGYLQSMGYEPPAYLKNEWRAFPAVRKIEMAYEAAETASPGKGGKKFLAMLSKKLAQMYEGISYEGPIQQLHGGNPANTPDSRIRFQNPARFGQVEVPSRVRGQIMAISRYTESGALGGNRGILKFKFGLPDDEVYDILRSSNSSAEALEKGLKRAPNPPTPEARLQNISSELQTRYEGARQDAGLRQISKGPDVEPNKSKPSPAVERSRTGRPNVASPDMPTPGPATGPRGGAGEIQMRRQTGRRVYSNYVQKSYSGRSMKFGSMRRFRGGFGGVIFGSKYESNLPTEGITSFTFIPANEDEFGNQLGTIEIKTVEGLEWYISSVYREDFSIACQILFGEEMPYEEGDGIGLVGIENPSRISDAMIRYDIVMHPELLGTELGYAAVVCDALPLADSSLLDNIATAIGKGSFSYGRAVRWIENGRPGTWKVLDYPVNIGLLGSQLIVEANLNGSDDGLPQVYMGMSSFEGKSARYDRSYRRIIGYLIETNYEYYRLNEFARILFVLRNLKELGGTAAYIPSIGYDKGVPASVYLNNERLQFYSDEEELEMLDQHFQVYLDSLSADYLQSRFYEDIQIAGNAYLQSLLETNRLLNDLMQVTQTELDTGLVNNFSVRSSVIQEIEITQPFQKKKKMERIIDYYTQLDTLSIKATAHFETRIRLASRLERNLNSLSQESRQRYMELRRAFNNDEIEFEDLEDFYVEISPEYDIIRNKASRVAVRIEELNKNLDSEGELATQFTEALQPVQGAISLLESKLEILRYRTKYLYAEPVEEEE